MENSVITAKHWGFYCLYSVITGDEKSKKNMESQFHPLFATVRTVLTLTVMTVSRQRFFPVMTRTPLIGVRHDRTAPRVKAGN